MKTGISEDSLIKLSQALPYSVSMSHAELDAVARDILTFFTAFSDGL